MPQPGQDNITDQQKSEDEWYLAHPGADPGRPETWDKKSAIPITPPEPPPPIDPTTQYYGFGVGNILHNAKTAGEGLYNTGKDVLFPPGKTEADRLKYLGNKYIFDPADRENAKAKEAQPILSSLRHSTAAAIPILGPAVDSIYEQAKRGDVGGAAVQAAVPILTGNAIGEGAGAISDTVGDAFSDATHRPITAEGLNPAELKGSLGYQDRLNRNIDHSGERTPSKIDYKGTLANQNQVRGTTNPPPPTATPILPGFWDKVAQGIDKYGNLATGADKVGNAIYGEGKQPDWWPFSKAKPEPEPPKLEPKLTWWQERNKQQSIPTLDPNKPGEENPPFSQVDPKTVAHLQQALSQQPNLTKGQWQDYANSKGISIGDAGKAWKDRGNLTGGSTSAASAVPIPHQVLAHELGHSIVAHDQGIPLKGVGIDPAHTTVSGSPSSLLIDWNALGSTTVEQLNKIVTTLAGSQQPMVNGYISDLPAGVLHEHEIFPQGQHIGWNTGQGGFGDTMIFNQMMDAMEIDPSQRLKIWEQAKQHAQDILNKYPERHTHTKDMIKQKNPSNMNVTLSKQELYDYLKKVTGK